MNFLLLMNLLYFRIYTHFLFLNHFRLLLYFLINSISLNYKLNITLNEAFSIISYAFFFYDSRDPLHFSITCRNLFKLYTNLVAHKLQLLLR